ncbi:hypothetical protein D3C75_698000 [compost metagenome]
MLRYKAAFALAAYDMSPLFQIGVGFAHSDLAYLQRGCQTSDRRQAEARLQQPGSNPLGQRIADLLRQRFAAAAKQIDMHFSVLPTVIFTALLLYRYAVMIQQKPRAGYFL